MQVHTLTLDIIGDPTLIKDVSDYRRQQLETNKTPPNFIPIKSLNSHLNE
jgi:hypothetical protein